MDKDTRNAFGAAALIMAAVFGFMLAMPTMMTYVTGFGPAGGIGLALVFMAAFFAVLWLRGRYQNRHRKDEKTGQR